MFDNRIYQREWHRKYRKKYRIAETARMTALRAYPEVQKCVKKGCLTLGERHHPDYSKPKEIVWLCRKHHEEIHHKKVRLCEIQDCDRRHWAKGMCSMHLKRSDPKKYA